MSTQYREDGEEKEEKEIECATKREMEEEREEEMYRSTHPHGDRES